MEHFFKKQLKLIALLKRGMKNDDEPSKFMNDISVAVDRRWDRPYTIKYHLWRMIFTISTSTQQEQQSQVETDDEILGQEKQI